MDRKKIVERTFLDAARKLSPDLPTGEPVAWEEPDFVWPDHDLGLDVTEIRQPRSGGGFEPARIESFRIKVAQSAEREYRRGGGRAVDVMLSFATNSESQRNAAHVGKEVAAQIAPSDWRTSGPGSPARRNWIVEKASRQVTT